MDCGEQKVETTLQRKLSPAAAMIIDAAGPQGLISKRCVFVAVFQSGVNAALGFHYFLQVVIKPRIECCKLPPEKMKKNYRE